MAICEQQNESVFYFMRFCQQLLISVSYKYFILYIYLRISVCVKNSY